MALIQSVVVITVVKARGRGARSMSSARVLKSKPAGGVEQITKRLDKFLRKHEKRKMKQLMLENEQDVAAAGLADGVGVVGDDVVNLLQLVMKSMLPKTDDEEKMDSEDDSDPEPE